MVEIHKVQDSIVLRKSGSELLILPVHVIELKKRHTAKDFAEYFLNDALVNRPARKLYENWLRKDGDLWRNLFKTVQSMEISSESDGSANSEKKHPSKTVQETVVAQTRPSLKETQVAVPASPLAKLKPTKETETPTKAIKDTPKKSSNTITAESSSLKSSAKSTVDSKTGSKQSESPKTSKSAKTASTSKADSSASSKKEIPAPKKKEAPATKSAAKKPSSSGSAKASSSKSAASKAPSAKSSSAKSKGAGAKKSSKK